MKIFFITLVITMIAVAFMVVGLLITRLRRGRDLQSDVGSNDDMRDLGLECTSMAAMREEMALRGERFDASLFSCSTGSSCLSCGEHSGENSKDCDPSAESCKVTNKRE